MSDTFISQIKLMMKKESGDQKVFSICPFRQTVVQTFEWVAL